MDVPPGARGVGAAARTGYEVPLRVSSGPPAESCMPETAMPTPSLPDVSTLSFEEALAELERIVRALEGGQQKLEEAIGAYERGALLRQHCEARLAEAEQRR